MSERRGNPMRLAARWGLFGVAVALGLGLIGSTWVGYRDAQQLAPTLARGQAETYLRSFLERMRPEHGPPSRALIQSLLDEHADSGLRYTALVSPSGRVVLEVGHSLYGPDRPLPAPGELRFEGGRVQMVAQPPPVPPPPVPPAGWAPAPPPSALPGSAPRVVLEFEPLPVVGLLAQARLNLVVGIIAAVVLMAAAAVLGWLLARADRAEEELGRQRHLASLGQMSAVLAHEIRNPLAAVKGHAQLLAEQIDRDHPARGRVTTVVEEVQRLERLTNQLLDFARAGAAAREPVDPGALLAAAAERVDPSRIEVDSSAAPETWSLDPLRMGQVLENLLRNALQASPDDAPIHAEVTRQHDELVYVITDRGEGLDPATREQLFEPFHTTRTRGTGLGLAIAQRIVELHGGRIEAANHPGGGAAFRIGIPRG